MIARNTAFTFKGKNVDVPQVARQLKVSHVLEGSVRKVGQPRAHHGAADRRRDRQPPLGRALRPRSRTTSSRCRTRSPQAIVKALKLQAAARGEARRSSSAATTNPEAYKLYLMARQYNATGNSRHREITVRLCKRAVEIDPNYARAWALLSVCQSNKVLTVTDPDDSGWDAAERALTLAPDLAEAHAAKGRVLGDAGRYEESLAEHMIALRLDPDSYEVNAGAARCFVGMRRYPEAIERFEKAAAVLDADFWALGMSVSCHEALGDPKGMVDAARRTLARVEKVIVTEPDHGLALSYGVMALAVLGETERAKEWGSRALLLDPDNANLMYNLGCSMVRLGEIDEALKLFAPILATAQVQSLNWWRIDSDLDPIRDHPRFKAMFEAAEARLAT